MNVNNIKNNTIKCKFLLHFIVKGGINLIKGINGDLLRRVYDFSEMTEEELRCKFFQKLEECITLCNNTNDIIKWIKDVVVEEEVNELLTLWLEDGTLKEMINSNLIDTVKGELREEIDSIKDEIEVIKVEIEALKIKGD